MSLTTNRNDPELHEEQSNGQNKKYIVLSDEERAKGFIRPLRDSYIHVGKKVERDEGGRIIGRLILIDDPDCPVSEHYTKEKGYGGYIAYPKEKHPLIGKFITQEEVDAIKNRVSHFGGCGEVTKMNSREIVETYARNPKFYGATFCIYCKKHLPVEEFEWVGTNELVGS